MRFNGQALRQARQAKGLTQLQLANASGTNQTAIANFERGARGNDDTSLAYRIAGCLGVEADTLVECWERSKRGRAASRYARARMALDYGVLTPSEARKVPAPATGPGHGDKGGRDLEREVAMRDALDAAQVTIERLIQCRSWSAEAWLRGRAEVIGVWGRAVTRLEKLGVAGPCRQPEG